MKMNYLLKSKPKNEQKGKIIAVFVIFLFLSLFGFLFPIFTRGFFLTVAEPLWSGSSFIVKPFGSIKNYFSLKGSLAKENSKLEEELKALRLRDVDYELLLKENETLKIRLGRNMGFNRTISRVLSKPPRSPYDTLIIDSGLLHNVNVGDMVFSSENILIGRVNEVTSNKSVVQLFSSGSISQESILLRTGASFTLIGSGGANFKIEVPKDTDVLWGDAFAYPGFSSSVMAIVYYIDTSSQGSFKTVYLRIPGNVFQIQWAYVESQQERMI